MLPDDDSLEPLGPPDELLAVAAEISIAHGHATRVGRFILASDVLVAEGVANHGEEVERAADAAALLIRDDGRSVFVFEIPDAWEPVPEGEIEVPSGCSARTPRTSPRREPEVDR